MMESTWARRGDTSIKSGYGRMQGGGLLATRGDLSATPALVDPEGLARVAEAGIDVDDLFRGVWTEELCCV